MKTTPIGVRELLERVAERVRYGRSTAERMVGFSEAGMYFQHRFEGVVEAIIDLIRTRSFRQAGSLIESFADLDLWTEDYRDILTLARVEFAQVCKTIEEIDTFLNALPAEVPQGFLPDIYRDVATLGIVADWCEDHDSPHSATEARRLLTLLRQWM